MMKILNEILQKLDEIQNLASVTSKMTYSNLEPFLKNGENSYITIVRYITPASSNFTTKGTLCNLTAIAIAI